MTDSDKRVGRPKKSELEAKKKRSKRGRPPGEASIIAEYKSRMLASPKSRKVLDSILSAATTDGHPNQAAAWKLWMDRALPVSMFDSKKGGGSKPAVTINITGMDGASTIDVEAEEVEEADYVEMEED
jgi:hypothetical protein